MMKLLYLGLAGAAGTLARFGVMEAMKRVFVSAMPWGTWMANILGCFLFGLIWVLAEKRGLVSTEFRLYALVGFMGSFTTFSTFAFESVDMFRAGYITACLLNIVGQNVAGVAAVTAGMAVARALD